MWRVSQQYRSHSHHSSPHQQSLSLLRRLRRVSRPRRPSRHLSYAALVVLVLQFHRGQLHSVGVHTHHLDLRVRLQWYILT